MLAGGRGKRFAAAGGKNFKQRLPLGGRSLLEQVCNLYRAAGLPVLCALHPALEPMAYGLATQDCDILTVLDADKGMGNTLAAAVRAFDSHHGWVIGLADMPQVQPATIRAVADTLMSGAPLCAPFHGGRRGHPVGFSVAFREQLARLEGDQGARGILHEHAAELVRIEVDDPGILFDIDLPEDWPRKD